MTEKPDKLRNNRIYYLEALVPVLAFGSTLSGIALWEAGILSEIQYAAAGSFLASCLLAYLAWYRPRKDIVSLTTPLYGLLFFVTPIDYYQGILLQLFYAAGLTALVLRLHFRFGAGADDRSRGRKELAEGPLRTYVESTRDVLAGLEPAGGRNASMAFLYFAEGEYRKAADVSHAGACQDGTPEPLVRAFGILRQHAELLEKNLPRPVTYQKFLPADAALMAKPQPAADQPDREFETMMDNALLLLYSAAWHASEADRPILIASQPFANKLLEA